MISQVKQATETVAAYHVAPREAIGGFDVYGALEDAVDELLLAGFARRELSPRGTQAGLQTDEPAVMLADDPAARRPGAPTISARKRWATPRARWS